MTAGGGDAPGVAEAAHETAANAAYFDEFRNNWRALVAATLGMAAGYTINNYLNNLFIPHLMREFGWPSARIALIGLPVLLSVMAQPIAGRLTDRFGVRRVALVGVIGTPLAYLALSRLQGSFTAFFVINVAQILLISATTGPVVYSRLVAQNYRLALGLALALVSCTPAIVGMVGIPVLSGLIAEQGWRAGYVAVACATAIVGGLGLLLVPKGVRVATARREPQPAVPIDYRRIVLAPAFVLISLGMLFCNVSVVMQTSQLNVILLGRGIEPLLAAQFMSLYPAGVFLGRLLCGIALDRLPSHMVSAISLGLPGFALAALALGPPNVILMAGSVLVLGLALGADGDIAAYLVRHFFPIALYSTVLGFVVGAIALSSAMGSLLLSLFLSAGGGFAGFMLFSSGCSFIGASLFWLLGRGLPQTTKPQVGVELPDKPLQSAA